MAVYQIEILTALTSSRAQPFFRRSEGSLEETLERFLSAMQAWIEDMDGFDKNNAQPPMNQPTWQTVADILIAAKMYE